MKKIVFFFAMAAVFFTDAAAKETTALETVTVTAQKMEQDVQKVPMSITVFDEIAIEDRQIESVKDIAQYTPNLLLFNVNSSGVLMPTIRGMNTEYASFSTAMAMFVDGVPIIGTSGLDAPIADVERIEVLKGPQGTLYGKGTESGVINIITKKPDNQTRAKLGVELGSDNKRQYSFQAAGPLVKDKLYVAISGRHYEKDGFVENAYLNRTADDIENDYGKIVLRFTPLDNLDISLVSSKLENDNTGTPTGLIDREERVKETNEEYVKTETTLHALKVAYDIVGVKLESITTQKRVRDIWLMDYDYTPEVFNHSQNNGTKENISQEFRVSAVTGRLDWLVGANFSKDDLSLEWITLYGASTSSITNDEYGLFAHLDYQLTDRFSLLGGLRYDKNESEYDEPGREIELSFTELSPKFGVEYQAWENSMIYGTISKGYRPGGFYPYATPGYPDQYDQEALWSYEIGSKNIFLNGRLVLNAAAYYMKVDDMQVSIGVDYSSYKDNAAEATSKGFELDLNYKATNDITLFAALGYNHTTFDEYSDSQGDYAGKDNPYAPEYNYNLGAQYRNDKGYFGRVDINGYGDMYFDRANQYSMDAYTLVNTKLGYEQERFDVYIYAQNLFDKNYDYIGTMNGRYRTYSPPREMGLRVNYRF